MTTDQPVGPGGSSVSPGAGAPPKTSAKAILVSIVAAVGGFLFGFDSSVINGAVDALNNQFDLTNSPLLSGFAVACALLGSAVGAWFAGPVADRYGRVRVMLIAAALFAISSIGSGLAFAVWDLIIWRFLAGVGIGIASVIASRALSTLAVARRSPETVLTAIFGPAVPSPMIQLRLPEPRVQPPSIFVSPLIERYVRFAPLAGTVVSRRISPLTESTL